MSHLNFFKISINFLILGFIWQIIIMRRVSSLKIMVDKQRIEVRIVEYLEHLNIIQERKKGLKGYFRGTSSLKKQATEICDLNPAQLLTLCQWIANSEQYKSSKFVLVRVERFRPVCFENPFQLSNEKNRQALKMVTCPYIKKLIFDSGLNEENLSVHPGVLFVSGSLGINSVLVFISHRRKNEIVYEPYGLVTEIDMAALKKIKKFKEVVKKATDASVEIQDLSTEAEDSEEFTNMDSSERPLRFRDLL